ncbi:TetR family transcriptional regulator [Pseudonocardia ailaonensis]|uniref:TetR family transcriptional regulator n=1 Tax=Pseudonocardia ailaonensis TaxID=367279 RepID=A0ABN2N1E2_9PSEU
MSGLRERKKARTRADLQRHALRLIRDRGWAETTADDIAAAAEVSRSTFFRYFPSKIDVVLFDDVDPLMAEAMAEQPAGTPLLVALRRSLTTAFGRLDPEKRELEELRMRLAAEIPEISAALRERGGLEIDTFAAALGEGFGLDPGSIDVQLFCGLFLGARSAARSLVQREPGRSYIDTLDMTLRRLEQGVPLADVTIPGDREPPPPRPVEHDGGARSPAAPAASQRGLSDGR